MTRTASISLEAAVSQSLFGLGRRQCSFVLMEVDDYDLFARRHRHIVEPALRAVIASAASRVGETGTVLPVEQGRFVLILPGLPLEAALILADNIRHSAAEQLAGDWLAPITISGGAVIFPAHGRRASTLSRALTATTLRARVTGGNRVVAMRESEMVVKAAAYPIDQALRLKELAARLRRPEAGLLREALRDLLNKHGEEDSV